MKPSPHPFLAAALIVAFALAAGHAADPPPDPTGEESASELEPDTGTPAEGATGGASIDGTGISQDGKSADPPPTPKASAKPQESSVSVRPFQALQDTKACYDTLKADRDAVAQGVDEGAKALQSKGRLICWVTGNGKHVNQYEDGSFLDGKWHRQAKLASRGAALMFQDKFGGNAARQRVRGYKTRVRTHFNTPGAYMDTLAPARIPDSVEWTIYLTGGYKMTFAHSNSKDCIYSGNGVYTFSGGGKSLAIPAQSCNVYRGLKTCIRCRINCRW
ncbi:hypothetical protein ACFL2T_05290 [Elusimicrobiota bacterium]